ncbi:MAG: SIMPL domain-containing protein [Planctomycetales bacterium]|nr:SIMPL domain-containing protein [Planctomycetales bacterium]
MYRFTPVPSSMLAVCMLCFSCVCWAADEENDQPTISVAGSAEVFTMPDRVQLWATIVTRARSIADATDENDQTIRQAIQFLNSMSVEQKNISTEHLSLEPMMRDSARKIDPRTFQGNNESPFVELDSAEAAFEKQMPVGYIARRTLRITINELNKFDSIYKGLVERGINNIGGISFETSELRKYRDQARILAIRAAKEKAAALAGELGAELAAVQTISETDNRFSYGGFNVLQNVSSPFGNDSEAEALAAGRIRIQAEISVVFILKNNQL